ncbi:hypothetical protein SETIT_4G107400v2 [Setaria italica]|uniref:Uncharacterized protein n=3 Tax=Setaria italica TaxID=4555 RepID=A0A368QT27_SETIT|nr:uncharacterized protein LOC101759871 isoform X1 [Setaria italica]RCV21062.1 hypothetical protein SETIT_4G107400v2 [Setaria italica]
MARPALPPSSSLRAAVKREIDAVEATAHTPAPPPRKKRRRGGRLPVTPTQLPLSPTLLTPQIIPSAASGNASVAGLTPTPARSAVKREPGADTDVGARGRAPGKPKQARDLRHGRRPAATEPPTLWLNRRRLGRILHELAGAHRWREAAGVVSTHLRGIQRPGSFQETRSLFVVAMEIHKQLAEDSGVQQSSRRSYYLRTKKLFDVWLRKLIWFPSCPKKHLVILELALFYLSQGNIDNAYNTTRILIAKDRLQTEPILNLIHGLISFDKWYSGLPKDMQVEEFDVYSEACAISIKSDGCEETGLVDDSDDNSIDDDASLSAYSSESSINNEDIDRKINEKPFLVYPKEENDPLGSEVNEDFRSIFLNTSDGPTCGLEKSLLPLRLKIPTGASNDCFDRYWQYKSAPNTSYEDAEKCLRLALHSNPPVMAALLPLIQILLLGDKLKDALDELERTCLSSTTALPFRLRGRLLEEYFDQNQVSTISSCYEEALRRDPTCSYSMERLIKMHRKGYYNTIQLLEAIALHLDSVNGKPCIWEELVLCFLRLFSDKTADYEDCIACTNTQGDQALDVFSKFSSFFFERFTRESWKARCRWWMHHHFSQNAYASETLTGDCKLLAAKAACAAHLFGPEFPYVKAAGSYIAKQESLDEVSLLVRKNSVRLLQTLEKLTS